MIQYIIYFFSLFLWIYTYMKRGRLTTSDPRMFCGFFPRSVPENNAKQWPFLALPLGCNVVRTRSTIIIEPLCCLSKCCYWNQCRHRPWGGARTIAVSSSKISERLVCELCWKVGRERMQLNEQMGVAFIKDRPGWVCCFCAYHPCTSI